jgi:predicted membrane metal-binding protein
MMVFCRDLLRGFVFGYIIMSSERSLGIALGVSLALLCLFAENRTEILTHLLGLLAAEWQQQVAEVGLGQQVHFDIIEIIALDFELCLKNIISYIPYRLRSWPQTMLLGESYTLSQELKNLFVDLNIYHLLIISGFHVSLLLNTCKKLLNLLTSVGPFKTNPTLKRLVHLYLQSFCCLTLLYLLKFAAPTARAVISSLLRQVETSIGLRLSAEFRIMLTYFIFVLWFPQQAGSKSGIISYGCYAVLAWTMHSNTRQKTLIAICFFWSLAPVIFHNLSIVALPLQFCAGAIGGFLLATACLVTLSNFLALDWANDYFETAIYQLTRFLKNLATIDQAILSFLGNSTPLHLAFYALFIGTLCAFFASLYPNPASQGAKPT